jgi:hypothetical protein
MRKGRGKNPQKIYSRFDLGRVPVTKSVEIPKPETLLEFAARLEREERERRERPIREAASELTNTLRQYHQDVAAAWRQPIAKLEKFDRNYAESLFVDLGLERQDPDADPTATAQSVKDEFKKFVEGLPSRGYVIDREGSWRLQSFIQTQLVFGSAKIDQPALQTIFDWMVTHQVFSETELRYVPELIPPVEVERSKKQRHKSVDEILATTDTSTRDGNSKLKKAVDYEWAQAYAPMIEEFYSFLQTVYGVVLKDEDADYLFHPDRGIFAKFGWQINAEKLNAARRHCANLGKFVDAQGHPAITTEEYFDAKLSRGDMDYATYNREAARFSRLNLWASPLREAKTRGLL